MKEFIIGVKASWSVTPNSVKFWNGLVLLGVIVSGFISLDLLYAEWGLMSIFVCALLLDTVNDVYEERLNKHIWIYFTPLSWIIVIAGLIVMGCIVLYDVTIVRFNNWLNKK